MKLSEILLLFCTPFILLGCYQRTVKINTPQGTMQLSQHPERQIHDETSGLIITRGDGKLLIGVRSVKYRFDISLPHSDTWEINSNPRKALLASDNENGHIVSVMVRNSPRISAQDYLQEQIDVIRRQDPGTIENQEISTVNGRYILKYRYQPEKAPASLGPGYSWRNYWTAVFSNDRWYVAHWSEHSDLYKEANILLILSDMFRIF